MTTLSAIVPTLDRPDLLRDTLAGLADQEVPANGFEVVVVDDGSRMELAPVVEGLSGRIRMRLERQEPSGLNTARNRGASVARGEILAFLDDDVLIGPGWASAVLAGFASLQCDALAGRIQLELPCPTPRWLSPPLRRYLAELDLGEEARVLAEDEVPYGANCAVTRAAFEREHGFAADLDRAGTSLRSNGDVEFFRRLRRGGASLGYWPRAVVTHRVAAERLSADWFRRRAFGQGHSDELLLPRPERRGELARRLGRELIRLGRAGPIFVKNLARGRGVVGATVWVSYCRGRIATLRRGSAVRT